MTCAARRAGPQAWERFVLENGWRTQASDLGAVIGQSVEEVNRVRRTGACTRRARGRNFGELFTLWHGRAPADAEWPGPRRAGAGKNYEWQTPELALLASLVGRLGTKDIARILTRRLRERTGNAGARRTRVSVQGRINAIGMQSADVLGGITVAQAGREIGSSASIHRAIAQNRLRAVRVGRLLVIPYAAWAKWKSGRVFPPRGYVPLRVVRAGLGIRSDKLSEFARLGYVPTAVRCNPYGAGPSTQFGTWYVDGKVARRLLAERRAGRAMPWHGKPIAENLRSTFKLWRARKHPPSCKTCAEIWGKEGAPRSYEDYERRYPPLAHGAKRHLTRLWTPGLAIGEVAALAGRSYGLVLRAIRNGQLNAGSKRGKRYVTRTDATRWIARRCPTGDGDKAWISLRTASKRFLFTIAALRDFIADKKLTSKIGTHGAARGVVYVSAHQCGQLRETIGFTEEEAARRVGVTVPRLKTLLDGLRWRKAEGIPLCTVQAAIKRLESREGYTFEEAAAEVGVTVEWVKARKDDGTIKVSRAKWDRRRVYISAPMLARLRAAKRSPVRCEQFSEEWLLLRNAAREAGVSPATIMRWGAMGEIERRRSSAGWRYPRDAVRARARLYWKTVRFHRAMPPEWLLAEARPGLQRVGRLGHAGQRGRAHQPAWLGRALAEQLGHASLRLGR